MLRRDVNMFDKQVENFKSYLEIEERSSHTIRQYLEIIDWFSNFLKESNLEFNKLTENDIIKFQIWLKRKKATRDFEKKYNKKPSAVELEKYSKEEGSLFGKSLYKYLTTIKKFLQINDYQLNLSKIPTPKYDDNFKPDVLAPNEIEKIANAAYNFCSFQHHLVTSSDCTSCSKFHIPKTRKKSSPGFYPDICFYYDGLKLKAMILLAYEAALRTDELCSLKLKHLDLIKKELFVEQPLKHSQQQAIPLSDSLIKILEEYLVNHRFIKENDDFLFPTKTGKKYHANNFATHVFRPIAKIAGFDVRYYTLRHSRATNLIKQGLDVGWVRRITRHRNINNVLKYIHLSSQDIRKELEKKDII